MSNEPFYVKFSRCLKLAFQFTHAHNVMFWGIEGQKGTVEIRILDYQIDRIRERRTLIDDIGLFEEKLGKELTESELYDRTLGYYKDGRYEKAIADFKSFLKSYPDSDLADNAHFWIGECFSPL